MRKRYTHIIIALLFFSIKCWAQLDIGMQNSQPVIPSWENYEMMKYGKIGASMYTGTVNYSIPIYTYKDKDFEIPISIDYATNGFRVNHSSGILGHGWSLYTPGVITRQIRGIPDEQDNLILSRQLAYFPTVNYHGYSQLRPGVYDAEMLISDSGKAYIAKFDSHGNYYETNPDLYSFNFCGFTGAFTRNNNNESVGGSVFRVFGTEGAARGLTVTAANSSAIEMVDNNGYNYHFVFSDQQQMPMNDQSNQTFLVTTSWILSSITAPNGREVTFGYELLPMHNEMSLYGNTTYIPRSNHYSMQCNNLYTATASSAYTIDQVPSSVRRLSCVSIGDDTFVKFTYETGVSEKCLLNGQTHIASCDNARLAAIYVIQGMDTLKSCLFSYDTSQSSNGNTVTFLKQANISGEGIYSFGYNDEDGGYPELGTTEYDHWGFYNGRGFSLTNPRNYIRQDSVTFDEWVIGGVKEPSFTCGKKGTLSRIDYPTGGYSLLDYEPHSYSRAVAKNSVTHFEPSLVSMGADFQAGGVRLSRIVTKLSFDEPTDTVWYDYCREDSSSLSSGILVNSPRYGVRYSCYGNKQVEFYDLSNQIYDPGRTHIEYSDVTMRRSCCGRIVQHYTTNATDSCMDFNDNNYSQPGMNQYIGLDVPTMGVRSTGERMCQSFNAEPEAKMILTPVPSYQFRRGRLEETKEYSADGGLVRRTQYTYKFPHENYDTVYQIAGEITAIMLNPAESMELASTTTTEYDGNTAVRKTEEYDYNQIGLPVVVKTSSSRGDTLVTRNTYVVDTLVANPMLIEPTITEMATRHLNGKLIKSETYRMGAVNDKLLSAARLTYYKPDPNKTKLFCPSTKQEWVSGDNWKTVEQYQFDAMGNLVEIVDESALANSYLWSYGSRHMVSTLQNATKSQTETALASVGLHSVDSLARMTNLTSADFGKVKNLGQQLLSSLQDAWRYRPLVGMAESAPPNHAGATYHYDGYGRLTEIRDDMGKVVGQQEYNIVSVLPMTSTMHRDSLRLNEGVVAASVTTQGGSSSYSYQWQLADSTGAVLQTGTGSQMSQNLLPGNYTLTFTVTDMVSGESATHTWLAAVPVRFTNISDPVVENGWTTVTASITLGAASNVEFTVEYDAPSTFKVTIGNQEYNYSGTGLTSIQKSLSAGTTAVSISMYNASQGEATLSLTSVGNLAIGLPCALSFGGLSKKNNQQ